MDQTQAQNQQQDSHYQEIELRLSVEISCKLQNVAQNHHVTLATIFQAAWALLLSRYSGEQDVVFGVTVSGRSSGFSGVENMVGLLINTLPLRLQISPDEQLISWLGQIQQLMWELQHYSYTPLVDIQSWSDLPGGIPLFESIMIFENYPVNPALWNEGSSLQISKIEGFEQTNYPLTVFVIPGDELLIKISYDPVRLAQDPIERMLGHLQTMLLAIAKNPQQKVGEIPLLSAAERHQLLVEWNDTATEYPSDKCIHQLFEEQVAKTPLAVAVVFENQQLTYQELNQKANQLAHHLQSLGVGPEVLVGICVERSIEMVIGLLGILKAGGAYVPIDPSYPQERVNFMLSDTQVSVLLTQQQFLSDLLSQNATVLYLDKNWHEIAQHSKQNPITEVNSSNLAYTIFTSGSTGKPKAVQILHSAVVNLLCTMCQHIGMTADDVLLGVTTFTFDIAGLEIFLPMIVGAYVVIANREVTVDGKRLLDLIVNSGITVMQATPATWQLLLETGWQNSAQLKILCGGEALPRKLANQLQTRSSCLWNVYGPTETTIWSLIDQVDAQVGLISIGKPIANTKVYILNCHLQPVPIGVSGELYIGGAGLARGYLNRPELTAEKFIQNPFCDHKSERLYQTGDLARYLSDGKIEYLGRIDHQVKIRGFRIELGEIEAVLHTYPQIQQAVVVLREDISEDKRLVAYIVTSDESLTSHQLREFIKGKLPEYMVPTNFVVLDALPLTPNGKVDRKALPAPDRDRYAIQSTLVAPRDTLELKLVQIWEKVLHPTPVGVRDHFFHLGGHSLLAVSLMALIQKELGQNLPLTSLFENATIEQQARIIRSHRDLVQTWSPVVEIQPDGSKPPFFCVHPVGGNVLCYWSLARYLGTEQPFYGLQAKGLDGQTQPLSEIEEMAACYIEAMRVVQPSGPYLLGGWSMGGVIALEMAQQLQQQHQEVALLVLLDSMVFNHRDRQMMSDLDDTTLMSYFAQDFGGRFDQNLIKSEEDISALTFDQKIDYVLEEAKSAGLLPTDVNSEYLRPIIDVFKANFQAWQKYVPQTYSNQIILFKASETRSDDLSDPANGWDEVMVQSLETYSIPGNHYTMIEEPNVQDLARQLKAYLEWALPRSK